jgi:hypothetical protein
VKNYRLTGNSIENARRQCAEALFSSCLFFAAPGQTQAFRILLGGAMKKSETVLGTVAVVASLALLGCFTDNEILSVDSDSGLAPDVGLDLDTDEGKTAPKDTDPGHAEIKRSTDPIELENSEAKSQDSDAVSDTVSDSEDQNQQSDSQVDELDTNLACHSHAFTACGEDGHVHFFNSCGEHEGLAQQCPLHSQCQNKEREPKGAVCECIHRYTGQDCETCPENWDARQDCNACAHRWTGTNCDECPKRFSVSSNCRDCQPGFAEANCETCVRYADAHSTTASPTGLSWSTAFPLVRDAVDAAAQAVSSGQAQSCEVWVADGTYYTYVSSEKDILTLRSGVDLYGGFAGDETLKTQRNPSAHRSILSGKKSASSRERVCQILTVQPGADVLVDGLVIIDGNASQDVCAVKLGAAVVLKDADVTFSACHFRDHQAAHGGALHIEGNSKVFLENCILNNNIALNNAGAVHLYDGASLSVKDVRFARNFAGVSGIGTGNGGAIHAGAGTSLFIEQSEFDGNIANRGGAISVRGPQGAVVKKSKFAGNYGYEGGAFFVSTSGALQLAASLIAGTGGGLAAAVGIAQGGQLEFTNCTIADIHDSFELPLFQIGNADTDSGGLQLFNTIAWAPNHAVFTLDKGATAHINYSIRRDDTPWSGQANTSKNPMFSGSPSASGYWKSWNYDNETGLTTLTKADSEPDWQADTLKGALIALTTHEGLLSIVFSNSTRTLSVVGTPAFPRDFAGSSYALYDYSLGSGSPCIDAGATTTNTPLTDIEGVSFADVPEIGVPGVKHDIGCYEYVP